jgi:SAM-dependent methyltransferase
MGDFSDLNRATYDRIAEDWSKDHANDTWWIEGTEALVKMLPQGASVLDVGCGSGTKTKYLSKKRLHVVGTDLSEKMVDIARRESPKNDFYVADMHDLSPVPGVFDCIFAQASLLHIPKADVDAVVEQFSKKLKPEGLLYIAVKGMREGIPDEKVVIENDYGYEYERFFSYFSMQELKDILQKHGYASVYEHIESIGWLQLIGRKS